MLNHFRSIPPHLFLFTGPLQHILTFFRLLILPGLPMDSSPVTKITETPPSMVLLRSLYLQNANGLAYLGFLLFLDSGAWRTCIKSLDLHTPEFSTCKTICLGIITITITITIQLNDSELNNNDITQNQIHITKLNLDQNRNWNKTTQKQHKTKQHSQPSLLDLLMITNYLGQRHEGNAPKKK